MLALQGGESNLSMDLQPCSSRQARAEVAVKNQGVCLCTCMLTGGCWPLQVGTDATDAALAAALAPDKGGFMCLAALNLCDCRRVGPFQA